MHNSVTTAKRTTALEQKCLERGVRMTHQRRIIISVLSEASDHPDAEMLFERAKIIDPTISIASIYRTMKVFEELGIVDRHDFGGSKGRYEEATDDHHDHLIDVKSGDVIEFQSDEIEALQRKIADELGYRLIDHRLELYAVPKTTEQPD